MCVRTYGSNSNNSAIYKAMLNVIAYLERYWNLLSAYVNYVLAG